ncbi:Uncharacterized protein DBV15_03143 [Temnothorax longispinosus]|uniref:Uncharacterized protein n=1 Tax=Temnothorax longispinosus TaxID=300112 RepID=A0A4S2KPC7_9HYME|nr:Uncharacterized protein DBV15_03143 [Temnothorax longispinosus]
MATCDEDSELRIILRSEPQRVTAEITMANPTAHPRHCYGAIEVTTVRESKTSNGTKGEGRFDNVASNLYPRYETARAVKPGEPWKRGIMGEKLARRKAGARPLVGMDATRDRGGVGGIEKRQDPAQLKCEPTVKFIARHVSPEKVSGKHDCPANHNSHTEISRNRAETKGGEEEEEEEEGAVPPRSLSRKLAKEDGESFHLRAASEVGANGGLKSFAIERRRNRSSLSSRGVAGSRPAEEQPVDLTRLPRIRRLSRIYPSDFRETREIPCQTYSRFLRTPVYSFIVDLEPSIY